MVILVGRQPTFYLLNVGLPVFFFAPMAMLQFGVPRDQVDARLSVSLAIVLTATAHKYTVSSLVPAVSYLTYIDKYTLSRFVACEHLQTVCEQEISAALAILVMLTTRCPLSVALC